MPHQRSTGNRRKPLGKFQRTIEQQRALSDRATRRALEDVLRERQGITSQRRDELEKLVLEMRLKGTKGSSLRRAEQDLQAVRKKEIDLLGRGVPVTAIGVQKVLKEETKMERALLDSRNRETALRLQNIKREMDALLEELRKKERIANTIDQGLAEEFANAHFKKAPPVKGKRKAHLIAGEERAEVEAERKRIAQRAQQITSRIEKLSVEWEKLENRLNADIAKRRKITKFKRIRASKWERRKRGWKPKKSGIIELKKADPHLFRNKR